MLDDALRVDVAEPGRTGFGGVDDPPRRPATAGRPPTWTYAVRVGRIKVTAPVARSAVGTRALTVDLPTPGDRLHADPAGEQGADVLQPVELRARSDVNDIGHLQGRVLTQRSRSGSTRSDLVSTRSGRVLRHTRRRGSDRSAAVVAADRPGRRRRRSWSTFATMPRSTGSVSSALRRNTLARGLDPHDRARALRPPRVVAGRGDPVADDDALAAFQRFHGWDNQLIQAALIDQGWCSGTINARHESVILKRGAAGPSTGAASQWRFAGRTGRRPRRGAPARRPLPAKRWHGRRKWGVFWRRPCPDPRCACRQPSAMTAPAITMR